MENLKSVYSIEYKMEKEFDFTIDPSAVDKSNYRYELTFGYKTNKTGNEKYNNLGMFPYFNFKDDDEAIDLAEHYLIKHYAIKDKTHKNLFVVIRSIKTNQVIKIKRYTR